MRNRTSMGGVRIAIGAIAATAAGLVAANMLGVAAAEAPTGVSVRTVSVQGVASVPVAQGASIAVSTAAYRLGMTSAVTDGQSKAEFLAGKGGAALGTIQSIAEGGGSISCSDGSGSEYVEYTGEQPDFGYANSSISPIRAASGVAAPTAAPTPKRFRPASKRHKHRSPSAKKATAAGCTLSTQVSLTYSLN